MDDHDDRFASRFSSLLDRAYRCAYAVLNDSEASEDVAQESLTRAYVKWRKVEPYADAWIARVSTNLAFDRYRAARRRLVATHTDVPSGSGGDFDSLTARMDLKQGLLSLPRRQREVVVLRYIADIPEAQVARLLGCSVGAVKTHAHRGLSHLRNENKVKSKERDDCDR